MTAYFTRNTAVALGACPEGVAQFAADFQLSERWFIPTDHPALSVSYTARRLLNLDQHVAPEEEQVTQYGHGNYVAYGCPLHGPRLSGGGYGDGYRGDSYGPAQGSGDCQAVMDMSYEPTGFGAGASPASKPFTCSRGRY